MARPTGQGLLRGPLSGGPSEPADCVTADLGMTDMVTGTALQPAPGWAR